MRQIRDSLRLSLGAVQKITHKAEELGLDWSAIEQLDDRQLAQAIFPESDTRTSGSLQLPDWQAVFKELRFKNVTKHLVGKNIANNTRTAVTAIRSIVFYMVTG